ncbi:hypothetical protein ISS85_01290 [Candidatus Microgenomates bacterium]|nr:hypothetical protein [Candidatus Microgenomates bacterium]
MTKRQKQIVIGTILGDAYLQKTGKENARLRLEHSIKQKDYIFWKYKELEKYMQDKPKKLVRFNPVFKKEYTYYRCQSHSSPIFGKLRRKFYLDNKKVIPSDIKHLLNESLALAVWYMDDGYYYHRDNIAFIYLSNFDKNSSNLLLEVLEKNFNLFPILKTKKKGKNLVFTVSDTKKLIEIIKNSIITSMRYKLPKFLL